MRDRHVAIIGPLAPPAGGMAGQTQQLYDLLVGEGVSAEIVQTNRPVRPSVVAQVRGVRALFRLLPYVVRLWSAGARSSVFHVMANSGWAWHLFAAPAIWIGKFRATRVVVNYRGGDAEAFLGKSRRTVLRTLRRANLIVVPSRFLQSVFEGFDVHAEIIPNVVEASRFHPGRTPTAHDVTSPHLVVARHLEPIYDIGTAIDAFALLRYRHPGARMSVAGRGPERSMLERQTVERGLTGSVTFCGELSRESMAELLRSATVLVNSSLVDNAPNSLLEAMACGVPVVSTRVGGIPYLVENEVSALLVPPRNPSAMADAIGRLISDPRLAARIVENATRIAASCSWDHVFPMWLRAYESDASRSSRSTRVMEPESS